MTIKIIGTSHIAKQSVKQVRETILKDKPEIVCVELDIQRFHSLMSKQSKKSLRDMLRFGGFGFAFAIVGQWIQKKLGDSVGVNPGADMKEAIIASRQVKAKLYLVDQPINQTMFNLSKHVSIWEKIRLVGYLLFSPLFKENRQLTKKLNLNKVPSNEIIDELILIFKDKFPNIYKVLVEDRNKHIARAVKIIEKKHPDTEIVLVIGAGHLKGIRELLSKNVF